MSVAGVGYNIHLSTPISVDTQRSHQAQAAQQVQAQQVQAQQAQAEVAQALRQSDTLVGDESRQKPSETHSDAQSTAAALEQIGQAFNKKLQFVVDQNSDQVIVKVIDRETDKVIKELPPEELKRLNNNLQDSIGFLFNEFV